MKKALFILATSSLFIFSSCSKEKDCMCTNVTQIEGQEEPSITQGGIKIAEGECSDLNKVFTDQIDGNEATTTRTCEER